MNPVVIVNRVGRFWHVVCSHCGTVAKRELDIDAESLAQRHMDEHARQRRVA
jgi:transcription initiation factor TFIIIB Brf1 subunit/transcription initiation factor TFIIB